MAGVMCLRACLQLGHQAIVVSSGRYKLSDAGSRLPRGPAKHTHTRKQQLEPRQLNYKEIWQGSLKGLLQRLALDTFICKMLGVIAVIRCQHKTNLNAFGGINYHLCLLCEERYFPHQSKREFVPALADTSWQLAMFQPPSVTESVKSPVLSTRLYTRIYCWKLTMAHKETYSHRLTIKQSRRKTEVSQYQSGRLWAKPPYISYFVNRGVLL